MTAIKPPRPRAGFGYSSAVTAAQMKIRKSAAAKGRKPVKVTTRKPTWGQGGKGR